MATTEVLSAYRRLYRHSLRAIQFAKPARYVLRETLRKAFREDGAKLDPRTVNRTIRFLDAAGRERGLEHSVLKNILQVNYYRHFHKGDSYKKVMIDAQTKQKNKPVPLMMSKTAYIHYDKTLEMLNKTMGLCLR